MDIEFIKSLCNEGKIKWTNHCLERMQERDISILDVKNCLINGNIIEDYPNDFPHPSVLIYGMTIKEKVLHVVCGTDDTMLFIITAYYPNEVVFESDMKTRRA